MEHDTWPTPTYEPISIPSPPRRPPRPVNVMPIVAEYPPSIRNVSLDNGETSNRPQSVWSSDDDDVMRRRVAAFFKSNREPTATASGGNDDRIGAWKKRRWLLIGIVVAILIIAAAVVGGVLGSRAGHDDSGTDPGDPVSRPSKSSASHPTDVVTSAGSGVDPKETGQATISDKSRVGSTVAMPFEDPYRIVAFLTADGHLATAIWTGSTLESFPITSDSNSNLPKPAESSPLHLIVLTQSDLVHILYVDEDHYLCLATMSARSDRGKGTWKGGRLETGDDGTDDAEPEQHQISGALRVTFEVHNNADDVDSGRPVDRVNILYEEGSKKYKGKDKYTLLSSIAPQDPSKWSVNRYQLSKDDHDPMNPQKDSQGFVFTPVFKDQELNPGQQSGVRIIWDLSNEDHASSIGVMKCKTKSVTEFDGCWLDMGHWETEKEHDKLLSMRKPLSLALQRLPLVDKSASQDFVLLILDGDNVLTELYWDGERWTSMRQFLAVEDKSVNATRSFSSIAVTPDGHLFGVSDGSLRWYQRLGNWWEGGFDEHDAGWKFVDVVNTSLSQD